MASVSLDAGTDRGQMFVVIALTLGVSLVVLAMLLNAVVFTETTATRHDDPTADAITFREDTRSAVADLLERENANLSDRSPATRFEAGVDAITNASLTHHIGRGVAVDVTYQGGTPGYHVRQNVSGNFTAPGGAANFTLEDEVTATRDFTMEVSVEETAQVDDVRNESFQVVVAEETESEIGFHIYRDGGDLVLAERAGDEPPSPVCTLSADGGGTVTVDLTGGALSTSDAQETCTGSGWPANVDAYDIAYERGDRAAGTFSVEVASDDALAPVLGPDTDPVPQPHAVEILYDATVAYEYIGPSVRVEGTFEVPGDEDD